MGIMKPDAAPPDRCLILSEYAVTWAKRIFGVWRPPHNPPRNIPDPVRRCPLFQLPIKDAFLSQGPKLGSLAGPRCLGAAFFILFILAPDLSLGHPDQDLTFHFNLFISLRHTAAVTGEVRPNASPSGRCKTMKLDSASYLARQS